MKQFKYIFLLLFIMMMSSCATIGPLLMKDSRFIPQAYFYAEKDSIYYHVLSSNDMALLNSTKRSIIALFDTTRHAVHVSDVLSGIRFDTRPGRGKYYQELPSLPQDTIVDIAGSALVPRVSTKSREYVLSCSPNEQYVISRKHLLSFYEKHSPEAYALHKKGQIFAHASWGTAIGSVALISTGLSLFACCEQPKYQTNKQMLHAGISLVAVGFGGYFATVGLVGVSSRKMREAIDLYNVQSQQAMPQLMLNAHVSGNGIGVSLQF
jgi:hypothetical protein